MWHVACKRLKVVPSPPLIPFFGGVCDVTEFYAVDVCVFTESAAAVVRAALEAALRK